MDCKPYSINCRLDEIAEAISTPTPFDIALVIVTALSAAGTLFIAWMNLRLIRRQHKLDRSVATSNGRARRGEFTNALSDEMGHIMASQVAGLSWKVVDRMKEWKEINRLGALTGETSRTSVTGCVAPIVMYSGISPNNKERWFEVQNLISERVNSWVDDPASADLSVPEEFVRRRKEGPVSGF